MALIVSFVDWLRESLRIDMSKMKNYPFLARMSMTPIQMDNCKGTNGYPTDGFQECIQANGEMYQVRSVYPPIQDLQPRVLVVVTVFILCFIVGVCGNASILTIIRGVMNERKRISDRSKRSGDNAILYIAALCICDFLVSLSLPPAIIDSVIGFWVFGTWMCKLHHVCGSVGRIVSTFLITSMSFDRYVAVCLPHHHRLRSRKFVLTVITCVCLVSFILLLPMLIYAAPKEIVLHELKTTNSNNVTRVRVFKCTDQLPTNVFYWFTCSTFILAYMVPLILIVFFNLRLISKIYAHTKVLPKSAIPVKRIVIYTLMIAFIYFICWTPYWFSVLYAIVMSVLDVPHNPNDYVVFMIFAIHLMPYFGTSINWILYGLLNTQLQMKLLENSDDHMSVTMVSNRENGSARFMSPRNGSSKPRAICDMCRSQVSSSQVPRNMLQLQNKNKTTSIVFSQSEQSINLVEVTDQTHL
ncbi:unnamed protein product [Auanema sp. JU1783]|nr:unnamed protein product [Auanema sp. JU1783]